MSTLHEVTIKSALLILLAACARPAYGGSASARQASSAPAASPARTGMASAPLRSTGESAPPAVSGPYASLSRSYSLAAANPRAAVPVLVIPAKETSPETYDQIVEDLNVMNRILEKSVTDAPELYAYDALRREVGALQILQLNGYVTPWQGDKWILRSSSGRPKPLYIGGYGAVFSFQVSFPLVPPPEAPKPEQTAGPTDHVWATAQRELADPQAAARLRRAGSQGEPYKPEAVEGLKNAMTAALKHATNIRDLEPDSWLTILVQGPASTIEAQVPRSSYDQTPLDNVFVAPRPGARTLLTLRAKKADIDRFAKGEIDETQFQQRVQIVTY